ncbi:MAG: NIPSNAP family protein [Phreatobacter sp.]
MADREQRRAKLAVAPGWGTYLDTGTPLLLKMENRILVPTAFSPLK